MTSAELTESNRATVVELTAVAILLSSLVRLATSLYVPALPAIGSDLHMTPQALTMTMTVYFGLFAVAALFIGPIADAWGRRGVILGGVTVFFAGCILCAAATSGPLFLLGRVLQGIGGSAIPVVTLAMVRDVCTDQQLIRVLGWMGMLAGLVPIFAPVLGGFLTQHTGWRSNFLVLSVCVGLVWGFTFLRLQETLSLERRQPLHLPTNARNYVQLLGHRSFLGAQLPSIFCFLIQGFYLSVAPFLFIKHLHLSSSAYGLTNLVVVGGLLLGRSLVNRLMHTTTIARASVWCSLFTLAGGILMVLAWAFDVVTVATVLGPTFVFGIGFGSLSPLGLHGIMKSFRDQSGSVLALNNAVTLAAATLSTYLGGVLMAHGVAHMTILASTTLLGGLGATVAALAHRRAMA